jgi:hypothetical protein
VLWVSNPAPIDIVIATAVQSLAKVQVPPAKEPLIGTLAELWQDEPTAFFHLPLSLQVIRIGTCFVCAHARTLVKNMATGPTLLLPKQIRPFIEAY